MLGSNPFGRSSMKGRSSLSPPAVNSFHPVCPPSVTSVFSHAVKVQSIVVPSSPHLINPLSASAETIGLLLLLQTCDRPNTARTSRWFQKSIRGINLMQQAFHPSPPVIHRRSWWLTWEHRSTSIYWLCTTTASVWLPMFIVYNNSVVSTVIWVQ